MARLTGEAFDIFIEGTATTTDKPTVVYFSAVTL
jgi:hypothetical protein